jgi:hypothetical protein
MEKNAAVQCPKCQHHFQVGDVLRKQVEEELRNQFNIKWKELKAQVEEKEAIIRHKEADLEKQLQQRLKAEKEQLSRQLKHSLQEEFEEKMNLLSQENARKTEQLRRMYQLEADNERMKRDMEVQEEKIRMQLERQMTEQLRQEAEKIQQKEQEKMEMRLLEREQTIDALKRQLEEASRKAEQGSMQLQGEVQEIALLQVLQQFFIYDEITEVPKGINGADVIQTVRNSQGETCGKMVYESKRTKEFNPEWIKKLKQDALLVKGDICIIVTETKPKGLTEIGYEEGVWICSFREVKSLSLALREGLLRISEAFASQSNKGEKMQMLYDYLTGTQFRMQITSIFEAYEDMRNALNKEKAAAMRMFAEREKQLDKLLLNATSFYTSIRTIAGSSVPDVPLLSEDRLAEEKTSPERGERKPAEKILRGSQLFS